MERKVLSILKRNRQGLSITDLVKFSGFPRSKVRITLAKLEGAKKVYFRKVGMAKLYYPKNEKNKK